MKKSGQTIKKRILKAFLSLSVISLVVTVLLAEASMMILKDTAQNSNTDVGQKFAKSSETLLIDQALGASSDLVQAMADNFNTQLSKKASVVESMSGYLTYMYDHPDSFARLEVLTPDEIAATGFVGGTSLHWLRCAPTVGDVNEELRLLGNVQALFQSVKESHKEITSIYITTDSGINLGYDEYVLQKEGLGTFETRDKDWYIGARDKNGLVISDAYSDSFGRGLTVTMSVPFTRNGVFAGVLGVDILIENLNAEVLSATVGSNGHALMISQDGEMISAPGLTEQSREPETFLGTNSDKILNDMRIKQSGINESVIDGQPVYIVFSSLISTNWRLAVVLPVSDIIEPAEHSNAAIKEIMSVSQARMSSWILTMSLIMLGVFVCIILICVAQTLKMSEKIAEPILMLNEEAKLIGSGNLEYTSSIHTGDEIENLSMTFEQMTRSLQEYINNLSKVTAEKERIGAELDVAKHIQSSMLPCIFPAFPERPEIDIYATMTPAKEVGGDFYDFFLIDEDHLAVVIADVSGKGVPAALFMVIAKTLIKNHAQTGESPADVFTNANRQLCENNEAVMFVTAWMGVLEISTGRFTFANAGHNPPLLKRVDGDFEYLKTTAGFVLAAMEDMQYSQQELVLEPGDVLYLYTDGVTEATDTENALYAEDRLKAVLDKNANLTVSELLPAVQADIDLFVKGAPQFDDITMLALKVKGRSRSEAENAQ